MYQCIVSDGDIVSDDRFRFLIGAVYHRSVLYVDVVANGDAVYISPHNRVKPNAAMVTHNDFSYNSGVLCQVTIFSHYRVNTANRFY
jgi:hypothetical protein